MLIMGRTRNDIIDLFDTENLVAIMTHNEISNKNNLYTLFEIVQTQNVSGGIQEEALVYGIPVLVIRYIAEKPEGVDASTLKLVGSNEEIIYNEFTKNLENKDEYSKKLNIWNSHAYKRVANVF